MAFDNQTRTTAILRCGGVCPNPSCNVYLLGPTQGEASHASIVEGAHIVSAKVGGPRHAVIENYHSLDNCIALCNSCHYEVDHSQNAFHYTAVMLRKWRDDAEHMAHLRKGTPIRAPYYDPEKARAIKKAFSTKLGEIIDAMWNDNFPKTDVITSKGIQGISYGTRGFNSGGWDNESPTRSPDDRIAFLQDDLVKAMQHVMEAYRKRQWGAYTWIGIYGVESFKENPYTSSCGEQADAFYRAEFAESLAKFKQLAYQFMSL